MVCALGGAPCGSRTTVRRTWTCPRLQVLVLSKCTDVSFSCLDEMISIRRLYADGRVTDDDARPLKLLKRKARLSTGSDSSSSSLSDLAVPPQRVKPFALESLIVHGGIIDEHELLSLQDAYDVDVYFSA